MFSVTRRQLGGALLAISMTGAGFVVDKLVPGLSVYVGIPLLILCLVGAGTGLWLALSPRRPDAYRQRKMIGTSLIVIGGAIMLTGVAVRFWPEDKAGTVTPAVAQTKPVEPAEAKGTWLVYGNDFLLPATGRPKLSEEEIKQIFEGTEFSKEKFRGINAIYQDDDNLTFRQIAERWEQSSPNENHKSGDVIKWLVGDMWLGKFEDENQNSVLQMVGSYKAIIEGEKNTYLSKSLAYLNRHRAFCFMARDSKLFDEIYFGQHQDMKQDACNDWEAIKKIADWETLSKIDPELFDGPPNEANYQTDQFRRRVLEGAILNKADFAVWLRNTKRPLPNSWGQKS